MTDAIARPDEKRAEEQERVEEKRHKEIVDGVKGTAGGGGGGISLGKKGMLASLAVGAGYVANKAKSVTKTLVKPKVGGPLAGAIAGVSKYSEVKDDDSLSSAQKSVQVIFYRRGSRGRRSSWWCCGCARGQCSPHCWYGSRRAYWVSSWWLDGRQRRRGDW